MRRLHRVALVVMVCAFTGSRLGFGSLTAGRQQGPAARTDASRPAPLPTAAANELWEAARRGDVASVRRALDAGVDVNTPFRYGATALSYACDRGHLEVVRVLLEHGAVVNVKDTFYGATPLDWASSPASGGLTDAHVEIVRLLLRHGAEGSAQALAAGVEAGHAGLVRTVLAAGPIDRDALTEALVSAESAGHSEIVAALKAAGAQPLPPADAIVDPVVLARYVGTYAAGTGPRIEVGLAGDRLQVILPGESTPTPLGAIDQTRFRTTTGPRVTAVFDAPEGAPARAVTVTWQGRQFVLPRAGTQP